MEKVYIKTSVDAKIAKEQGKEILKIFKKYGARPFSEEDCTRCSKIYYICEGSNRFDHLPISSEYLFKKEGYKEIFLNKTNQSSPLINIIL